MIGMVISTGKATMTELATTLSTEDLHDILEVVNVDAHNADLIRKWRESQQRGR